MENILEKQQVGKGVEALEKPEIVDGYWRVPVRWKDGSVTISNFPEAGVPVFEKESDENPKNVIKPADVIKFLAEHSKDYDNFEVLNWRDYFKKDK